MNKSYFCVSIFFFFLAYKIEKFPEMSNILISSTSLTYSFVY